MSAPSGWAGILDAGETIQWQGQPSRAILWRDLISLQTGIGLFFTGFALFWIALTVWIVGMGPGMTFPFFLFPVFGLPFLLIGIFLMVGHIFFDAYVRATTWYTLTDRSAFIASNPFGRRRLTAYPIADMPFLELEDSNPGTIWFGELRHSRRKRTEGIGQSRHGTRHTTQKVGFRALPQAREIYGQMRRMRRALDNDLLKSPDGHDTE